MTVCMVYHQSPVEELIRRCELAEYWLVVVKRELIRRTVHGLVGLIGRSTGDHGLQEKERRSSWNGRAEEGVVGYFKNTVL